MKHHSWRIVVPLMLLILSSLACGSSGKTTPGPTPTKTPAGKDDTIEACVMAQSFMGKYLKSPASAKWGPCYGDGTKYEGDGMFLVSSYVDSQNTFGAMLRQEFMAEVKSEGGERWILRSLITKDVATGEVTILAASGPDATATVGRTVTPTIKTAATPTRSKGASGPTVKSAANLRAGPGTSYAKTGSAAVGQALDIVGRNQAGDWYQLAGGAWIFADLVANPPAAVPVATVIPTPAAAAPGAVKAGAVPTVRGIPAASASDCDCDHGNTLNCDSFTPWDAQACFLRCKEIKGIDVHGLDRDGDGNACEWE